MILFVLSIQIDINIIYSAHLSKHQLFSPLGFSLLFSKESISEELFQQKFGFKTWHLAI